ncbi:gas vesicle protein [Streptomyces sp. NPDC050704]|uniref:gas vesicle protein GvpO n=1 Tax=Streptomyces sp. NPDC050704 TaxID=3157219 RepID=UPI003428907F
MSNTSNTSRSQSSSNSPKDDKNNKDDKSNRDEKDQQSGTVDGTPSPMEVLRHARVQLAELTGMAAESVSSFERTEDGWTLEVEVLEVARVPDTMSLLASYQVSLSPEGDLTGYRRVRRYERGRADPHRPGGR